MGRIKSLTVVCIILVLICLSEIRPQKLIANGFCSDKDTPAVCSVKKSECAPLNSLFLPPGGVMKSLIACSKDSGLTLGPLFFQNIGQSFVAGKPELLVDNLSSDPDITLEVRKCFFNASGLLDETASVLNRTALIDKLSKAPLSPNLIAPVFSALLTCPLPADLSLGPYLTCVRMACADNVAVSPTKSGPKKIPTVGGYGFKGGLGQAGFGSKGFVRAAGAQAAVFGGGPPSGDFTDYIPPQVADLVRAYTMG